MYYFQFANPVASILACEDKFLNGKEEFVWLKMDTPYSKTVIDTSKISIDVAEKWSKQAFLNSDIEIVTSARGTYSLRLTGSANNGVDFIGWIDMESWELEPVRIKVLQFL